MRGHAQTTQSIDIPGPQLIRNFGSYDPDDLVYNSSGMTTSMILVVRRPMLRTNISLDLTIHVWVRAWYACIGHEFES